MNVIQVFFTQPWVVRLGWTLLHFLWQGTLIAIVFAVARALLARSLTAHARYLMACAALATMTIAPLFTYPTLARLGVQTVSPVVWQMVPAQDWERALPWLVLAWLSGVVVFSARLIGGWRLASRMRSSAVRSAPSEWQHLLEALIRRMGAWRPVRLLVSSMVEVPTVAGWLRPVILMPVSALTGLPPEHVSALLAHELAHIRRHDYLANILQSVAEAVLFYHPAVWWVSEQIRAERELCCDDLAVAACGGDVLTYARALARVESFRPAHTDTVLAANGGSLVSRIRRLVGQTPSVSQSLPGPGAVLSLALLWLAGIGAVTLHGSQPPIPQVALPEPSIPVLAQPAPKPPASNVPVLSALLYDPLFALPHAATQLQSDSTRSTERKKTHLEGVIQSSNGVVMSKTTVRLQPNGPQPAPTSTSSSQPGNYTLTTDDAGKFAFDDVAPGRYMLTAVKTGFVNGRYGARSATSPGTVITVDEGQTLRSLDITLTPNGIVTGRITDSDGDPIASSQVSVLRLTYVRGRRQTALVAAGSTDDQGNFRISNVAPGRYYVGARPPIPGASGDGSDRNGPHEGNVPTYYPNSLDAANANAITVNPGAESQGIDIRLAHTKLYEFKAKLVNGVDGSPATGALNLERYDPASRNEAHGMGAVIREGGMVDYHNLAPGAYTAEIMALGGGPLGSGPSIAGRYVITITDQNVNTVLTFGGATPIAGVFKADDGDLQPLLGVVAANASAAQNQAQTPAGAATAAPTNAPRPRVILAPFEGNGGSNGQVKDDGTFQTTPAGPGKYFVDVSGLPSGVYAKSIRYGSQDATRAPLDIAPGAAGTIEIVLSATGADVSGTVRNGKDEIMPGVMVTVWPKTPNPGSASGGIKSTSTDQSGAFKVAGLAPGDYYVAAWEEIDSGLAQYPDFLVRFTTDAAEVKLAESAHGSADCKLIPGDKIALEASKLP